MSAVYILRGIVCGGAGSGMPRQAFFALLLPYGGSESGFFARRFNGDSRFPDERSPRNRTDRHCPPPDRRVGQVHYTRISAAVQPFASHFPHRAPGRANAGQSKDAHRTEKPGHFKPPPLGEGDRASGGRSSAVTFGEAEAPCCREKQNRRNQDFLL